jgi:SAM-dependent methyltransferase
MTKLKSELVKERLAKPDIHEGWGKAYRCSENERFWEQAFDYITRILNAPKNSTFLDVGCGPCAHSIRLANRGFLVQAIDFSKSVLEKAEANVKAKGLEDKIKVQNEDILALPFGGATFDYILCCGVLMHIPDLEKAISELARVLKPRGILVISECNMYSLQSLVLRNLRRFLGKGKDPGRKTPAGMEYWTCDSNGLMLIRQANIRWLIERFRSNGFVLNKRIAGQFTEAYTRRGSSRLFKSLIHGFNNFWFRYIKVPHLAVGNIVFLQKET